MATLPAPAGAKMLPPEPPAAVVLKGLAPALAPYWAQMMQSSPPMTKLPSQVMSEARLQMMPRTMKLPAPQIRGRTAYAQMLLAARRRPALKTGTRVR
jgi:hypothetical protein